MKPVIITMGEPAGIGPDIILRLQNHHFSSPIVIIGDRVLLELRARSLKCSIDFPDYVSNANPAPISIWHYPLPCAVQAGRPNVGNSKWVLEILKMAAAHCLQQKAHALITAPVHKAVINEAGFKFRGHTEFLATVTQADVPVMLLATEKYRVALATTHIPLKQVSKAITEKTLTHCIKILDRSLKVNFGISSPRIRVCGLNPHAGEAGYLGREEITVITPTLLKLKKKGFQVEGPVPADTAFIAESWQKVDAIVAMYHDQGLTAIKTMAFDQAVNVTLGLPIVRTSVDHGVALDLAGKGIANESSLVAAIQMAIKLRQHSGY